MKAKDIKIGTQVLTDEKHKARVIYNNCKQGDEVIVIEYEDGQIAAININDIDIALPTIRDMMIDILMQEDATYNAVALSNLSDKELLDAFIAKMCI